MKLKLLINTSSSYKGGGIQVAKSYIEEFKNFSDNEYCIVLGENLATTIDIESFPSNFKFYNAYFRPATKFFSYKSHNKFLKDIEKRFKPDIVFSIAGPSYWRPKSLHLMGFTIPHYIYPESPYFSQFSFKRNFSWKARKVLAQYLFKKDADVLVTQTDDVSKRVKNFLGKDKVYTVSNTINNHYTNPIKSINKIPNKNKKEFRLLTLSAWYPHKNLQIIPKIVKYLSKRGFSNIKFVTTLPDEDFKKLYCHHNIINVGKVKIEEGASLYQECDAMFLPTLLECFSASYAEAMIMKKPILTSDMGFAHTVCKDSALYFDPMNPEDIGEKIIQLFKTKKLQYELIQKGLKRLDSFGTAEDRAKRVLEICETILNES